MVRKIREVTESQSNKKGDPKGRLFCFQQNLYSLLYYLYSRDYQILIRSSGLRYNLSPGFTSNALYHASMFTGAPMVRY